MKHHDTVAERLGEGSDSALTQYLDIFVGKRSLLSLVKYELITGVFSLMPGGIGFLGRRFFYGKLLGRMGKKCAFGTGVALRSPGRIELGDKVVLDDNVTLDAKGEKGFVRTGDGVYVGKNTVFSCALAPVTLGSRVSVGPGCYIRAGRGPVEIGAFVTVGAGTVIISGNPDYTRMDIPMMRQEGSAEGVFIGDDIWIGVGAVILDGVRVGNGSVVGAGAVVNRDVPDHSIVAGVPAKVIGKRY